MHMIYLHLHFNIYKHIYLLDTYVAKYLLMINKSYQTISAVRCVDC